MFPKPLKRRIERRRQKDEEYRVIKAVREAAVARDQGCRFPNHDDWPHGGPLEMAHIEGWRRYETRNMPPEERHTVEGVAMLCRTHHRDYDQHRVSLKREGPEMHWWDGDTWLGMTRREQ